MKRMLYVFIFASLGAWAMTSDVNNTTGVRGLIMIDKQGDLVRFFDAKTHKEISTLTIDGTPHELAIAPDHSVAYVPDYGDGVYGRNPNPGHSIVVIDLATRKVSASIDVAPYQAPHGLQVDAKGTLYAVCDLSRKLLVIDPQSRKVLDAIDTDGTGHWVAVLPDGGKAYVANKNDRLFVSVIDLKTRKMIGKIPMSKGTQGITNSPDGRFVLAMDFTDPRVAVIDTATDTVTREIALEGQSKGAWRAKYSPDGAHLMVVSVNERSATFIDGHDLGGKQTSVRVGSQPFGIAYSADSRTALVSNHGDGTVTILDVATRQVRDTIKVGTGVETLSYY